MKTTGHPASWQRFVSGYFHNASAELSSFNSVLLYWNEEELKAKKADWHIARNVQKMLVVGLKKTAINLQAGGQCSRRDLNRVGRWRIKAIYDTAVRNLYWMWKRKEQHALTLNIPRGVLWGPQRVIFCDPAVPITTNLLLIFVFVPHQLKINIMQLDL